MYVIFQKQFRIKNKLANNPDQYFLYLNIRQEAKKSKYPEKPNDKNNDNNNIQDVFNLTVHRNE